MRESDKSNILTDATLVKPLLKTKTLVIGNITTFIGNTYAAYMNACKEMNEGTGQVAHLVGA